MENKSIIEQVITGVLIGIGIASMIGFACVVLGAILEVGAAS